DSAKPAQPAPAPDAKAPDAKAADESKYIIGPEDDLSISVWEQPTLSGGARVRSDGMITVPVLGEVKAAGLTPLALGKELTDGLSKSLVSPIVTVSLV